MLLFNKHVLRNIIDGGEGANGAGGGDAGESSGANAGAATDAAANAGGAAGGLDWGKIKESLPEELRNDTGLSTISSLEGLAKSYVHLQKGLGNKVAVPDKHATPEDWKMFFNKVGNPAKIEDYKLSLPKDTEVNEDFLNNIKSAAHDAGVLPWQLEKVLGKYFEVATGMVNQEQQQLAAQQQKDLEDIKKEWGEAFDTQKAKVNVALKELLPNEADRERLVKDGLASHPAVVRMLANAAKFFNEDTFIGHGEGKLGGLTPEDALKKANDIMGDMNHPYRNPAHPNHRAAQKEVQDLFSIAYPG